MAFYFYLSTKIIMVFITKSYQDLFGVRSYINAIANYNEIFRPNMNIIYDRGSYNHVFTPMYPGMGIYGFGTMSMPPTLQSATFKLKNGLHITTYGEYDADGNKVRNPSALPWERNNFNGAFEMKSENGNFGIRIEVQRGRNNPF